jgi:hypothetical protein
MVNYKCPRCGYEINIKTKYMNHLRRKHICKNILSDNNLQEEYIKYNITEKIKCKQNVNVLLTKHKTCQQNVNVLSTKNCELYECEYCNKQFNSRQGRWKHLKICKEKLKDDEDKENLLNLVEMLNSQLDEQRKQLNKQLEEQREQIKEQNEQIKELIKKAGVNIGTQNNIQNNIQILAYGSSDISHLTDKDYVKCLKHSNFCIPHLIKEIHFNPKKPENHNIYISNLKNNYVMIYNGHKWMLNDREESIQNLIDDKESIIEQKLEEWIENGNKYPDIMKKFNKYLEKKENDKVINKVKSEIKLMLFNNRDIVL